MSSSNRTGIAYVKEVSWGVNPGTQLQNIDYDSETLAANIDFMKSNSIDATRQIKNLMLTKSEAGGDISFEFTPAQYDEFLAAALFSAGWSGVADGDTDMVIDAGAAASNLEFDIDISGGAGATTLTLGSAVTHAIVEGQKFCLSGANAGNIGIFEAIDVAGNVITVSPDFTVTETLETVSGAQITGSMIRNGLTMDSFTIERAHEDVSQFFIFLGMVINTMSLDFNENSIAKGKFGFIGKNGTLAQATGGTGTNATAATYDKFNTTSNVANVSFDGIAAAECLVKQITVELTNNVQGSPALGVLGFCRMREGECDVNGKLSMYFLDESMYDRYANATSFKLAFEVFLPNGMGYAITLPNCRFTADPVNVSGKNTDVIENASYQAIMSTLGHTIQIDKFSNIS